MILPCAYCVAQDCISTPTCPIETISDLCETLGTKINQLENFTHPTGEDSWATRGTEPIGIAIEVPDYSCPKLMRSRGE